MPGHFVEPFATLFRLRPAIKPASCRFEINIAGRQIAKGFLFLRFHARLVLQIAINKGRQSSPVAARTCRHPHMVSSAPRQLAVLDEASRLLAEVNSLGEIKSIRDKAEAARMYVKAAGLGLELQNRAAELKIRAERKAGSFLRSLKLRGGNRRSDRRRSGLKLEDLGVSSDQSRRWQRMASVSEDEFGQYLASMNALQREVTSAGLLRQARSSHAGVQSAQSSPTRIRDQSDSTDGLQLLEELTNHCQLLQNVLRPVYELSTLELKTAEKRVIGRLLGEMTALIKKLKCDWPGSAE